MNINLYKCTSDNRRIKKNLTNKYVISGVALKDNTSILTPTFRLDSATFNDSSDNPILAKINSYNYVYVPKFKRYYYIENITAVVGGIIELSCRVDVLRTYKDDILNITTLVERQENKHSPDIVDNDIVALSKKRVIKTINVGNVGNNLSFILTTTGV